MLTLPQILEVNPSFFQFYNSCYDCIFNLDAENRTLTVKFGHTQRAYKIADDLSIKY